MLEAGRNAMNRRQFCKQAAALPLVGSLAYWAESDKPEVSITLDDPKTQTVGGMRWQEINERLLGTLRDRKLQTALFVCGMRIDSLDGHSLLEQWDRQNHLIANHSYSHLFFNTSSQTSSSDGDTTLARFETDFLKNEPLIKGYHHFARFFRFPFLKEGNTLEKRDGMRSFLRSHGYRTGSVTIDASDWAISSRLEARLDKDPKSDLSPYRDFFLQHIWDRAKYYDAIARRVLHRPVRHTLLLHYNALNALYLDSLIEMFRAKGWSVVDASYAYSDPVFQSEPNILPAGESLVWALAKETGKFESELRYPGEDDVYENPKMDALQL